MKHIKTYEQNNNIYYIFHSPENEFNKFENFNTYAIISHKIENKNIKTYAHYMSIDSDKITKLSDEQKDKYIIHKTENEDTLDDSKESGYIYGPESLQNCIIGLENLLIKNDTDKYNL